MILKGIYLLIIEVTENVTISIGALGSIPFQKGLYVYVGSAQNGIQGRLRYHYKTKKKLHWHVDYLLSHENVRILNAFYKPALKQEECLTAQELTNKSRPIPNFGCSDCSCLSHLFLLLTKTYIKELPVNGFVKFKES